MSSILRALKKLDEDSMSREREAGEEKIKMRRIVTRRARVPRGINRLLFIVLTVLLLGAAALIGFKKGVKKRFGRGSETSGRYR